jgi:hypothetical protein
MSLCVLATTQFAQGVALMRGRREHLFLDDARCEQ